jgi:3-deoxy-D-manno-octulosonic-acid transferase
VIALYEIAGLLAVLAAAPFALLWLAFSRRARDGFGERLAPLPRRPGASVWVHAASVGEAEAAAPVIEGLIAAGVPVVATTLTTSGRARLRQRFPGLVVRLAPLDLWPLTRASVRRARIAVLVLVETELWPSAIHATACNGGRAVLASARLSDRSFPLYRAARPLFRAVLGPDHVAAVLAQTAEDARRFAALGAPAALCSVIGDLKLDKAPAAPPDAALRAAIGPGPLLLGGSTHPGEEEALLDAWRTLRAGPAPALRLVLAPRHADRAPDVLDTVRRLGVSAALRSKGAAAADVAIVDTVGELGALYDLADLVFVGGTLARVGGHNLVEPVQAGKVVVHGPHTENQRAQERLLAPRGVLWRIESARELPAVLRRQWEDPERHRAAEEARGWLVGQRGAAERAVAAIQRALAGAAARG